MAHVYARHCVSHVSIANDNRGPDNAELRNGIRGWISPDRRITSTYLASRPLLGRDGQDSEGVAGYRRNVAYRMTRKQPTVSRTPDHEDSRRLASGLPADLSGFTRTEAQGSYLRADRSVLGRQTDPGDRRTSDWRSSTPRSDMASPSTGRPMCVSPTLINSSSGSHQQVQQPEELERFRSSLEPEQDITGNASRILMTRLRRPGHVA